MIISITKDWASDPEGTVPKYASWGTSSKRDKVKLARIDPNIWATI